MNVSIMRSNPRVWAQVRRRVLAKANFQCELQLPGCTKTATQVDHFISLYDDGPDDFDNLRASCKDCNLRKGASSGKGFFREGRVTGRLSTGNLSLPPLSGDYSE